jgi:hypothetical protein
MASEPHGASGRRRCGAGDAQVWPALAAVAALSLVAPDPRKDCVVVTQKPRRHVRADGHDLPLDLVPQDLRSPFKFTAQTVLNLPTHTPTHGPPPCSR